MIINSGKAGIAGRFQVSKSLGDADGNIIAGTTKVIVPWFDNLITDTGLDNVAVFGFMDYCSVGAGSTAPAFTDAVLASKIATSGKGDIAVGPSGSDYSSVIGTYTFPQGTAQGNLSEIGVSKTIDGTNLTSRALILDGTGAPTTIVVEAIAILTVTYEWRLYIDATDRLGTITVNGVLRDMITREGIRSSQSARRTATQAGLSETYGSGWSGSAFSGALGPSGVRPSGIIPGDGVSSYPSYVAGNRYCDYVLSFSTGAGNGLVSAVDSAMQYYATGIILKTSFDPPLEKDNTKTMSITWRRSWGRK